MTKFKRFTNAILFRLTAFVLRSFSQAYSLNLKYGNIISIDKNIVLRSAKWMLTQQNKNGSFTEYGKVFHKEMQVP